MTRSSVVHPYCALLAVTLLAGACASGAIPTTAPPSTAAPMATPTAAPTPTADSTPAPTLNAAPSPTPVAYGPAVVVSGIEACTKKAEGTMTPDSDGTTHSRGTVLACTDTSNDPRVSGTATYTWAFDGWASGAHVQWGAGTLANEEGTWEGTYTGSYSNTNGDILLFWFKGTGAYKGLSYGMWAVLPPEDVAWTYPVRGIIFPGSPPAP